VLEPFDTGLAPPAQDEVEVELRCRRRERLGFVLVARIETGNADDA
jgi:hypothetical protein